MNREDLSKITISSVFEVAELTTPSGYTKKVSNRPYSGFSLKIKGKTTYESHGKKYISNEDNIIFLPKGSSYTFDIEKSGCCYVVNFDTIAPFESIFTVPIKKHKIKIQNLMNECFALKIRNLPNIELKLKAILYEIIYLLLLEKEENISVNRFAIVDEYIDQHLSKNISNDELATILNVSSNYLLLLFKKEKGISPHQYVLNRKLEYAKSYLCYTNKQIKNIASELGFSDLYSFSKAFSKAYKISPRNYRKANPVS